MTPRAIWMAVGVLAAAVIAALVALRPEPRDAHPVQATAAQPAAQTREPAEKRPARSGAADLKLLPPEIRLQVESALKKAGARDVRVASVNTRSARGFDNLAWLFTPPGIEAPAWQREAWDRHMAPLVYGEGHPRAGQYRDSVGVEDVQRAAMPIAEQFFPPDYLDQPMLHVPQKRIDFNELNQTASRLWNREDPTATAGPFYDWLKAAPEDPSAYPSDFWLPAPPDHPEATTHRQWLAEEIARQVGEQLAQQRAQAGS